MVSGLDPFHSCGCEYNANIVGNSQKISVDGLSAKIEIVD